MIICLIGIRKKTHIEVKFSMEYFFFCKKEQVPEYDLKYALKCSKK